MNTMITPPQLKGIVPVSSQEITKRSHEARLLLRKAAEESLKAENPHLEQDYNGAEREGMISQRAAQLHSWMDIIWDVVGADLVDDLRTSGAYHPDLRSEPQELVNELFSRLSQDRMYQIRYVVNEVFPVLEQLGVSLPVLLNSTTKYKLAEVAPLFRQVLEEADEGERDDLLLAVAALSTKTMTEIREAKMPEGPKEFEIIERKTDTGVEWQIPYLTPDTRDWLLRKAQPFGRLRKHE
jgi:hypothetical protein